MRLDVQVTGVTVAKLFRERDEYVLKYLADAKPENFVSLTMPVRDEPWRWPRDLHPFFRQNLPEGYLLNIIREEFGRLMDGTDLSLLAVVGGMGIGRVTVTPEGMAPGTDLQPLQVESLLSAENTADRFAALVRQYARAAISGAVPKFLAPERPADEASLPAGRSTWRTSRYIIKGSDDSTPYLGFNEFYTMRVLEQLKVAPVAKTRMSNDGRVLIVDRFDVDDNAVPVYGVEDACSLLGLAPQEKYATTMEKVVRATHAYLPSALARAQLQQLGWYILTSFVVRNADAHSKNFAICYKHLSDVAYAPAYDIVTTQAYPRYAANPPGLSIGGRKSWAPGESLEQFFKARLGIAPKKYAEMVTRVCESATDVGKEMITTVKKTPQWRDVAKQMLHAWNEGMASLRSPKKSVEFRGLTAAIEAAQFSPATPAEKPAEAIGRSELLARRKKVKRRAKAGRGAAAAGKRRD
jgi:serine/threonine-protein kinase HipA